MSYQLIRLYTACVAKCCVPFLPGNAGKVESISVEQSTSEGEAGENLKVVCVYADYAHARTAANKLNGAEVDGCKLRAVIKSKDKPPSKKSLKKSRLIVRNLPFNVCGYCWLFCSDQCDYRLMRGVAG